MKNYNYIIGALVIIGLSAFTGTQSVQNKAPNTNKEINWISIDEAQELGKTNPKKVFIDVYTDWCGYCKKMDRTTFAEAEVVDYVNENYYAVKLNAESNKKIKFNGKDMTEAYLARYLRVSGYPTIVFVDEKFENIQPFPGYRTASQFKRILKTWKNKG